MVAVFTLVLHVAAIRTWVLGWRKSGAAIGFAAFLAFVMTAFTSLGGLASRSDRVIAERQDVLDTKADTKQQIADLTKERAALKFTRITKGAVDAAQQVADAAKLTKERECGGGDPRQRGRFCRDKEDGEGVALASLATATTNKAATDRFDEIEAQLKKLRSLKGETGVGSVNPLRDLLATIDDAATGRSPTRIPERRRGHRRPWQNRDDGRVPQLLDLVQIARAATDGGRGLFLRHAETLSQVRHPHPGTGRRPLLAQRAAEECMGDSMKTSICPCCRRLKRP
jgi:hypothetical protein